ncbi:MAG: 4-hydroxy-tetrahydrodipicolinate reductase [Polyangiales bacterium]
MSLKIAVHGVGGRMGRVVVQRIAESDDCALSAAIDRHESPFLGQDAGTLAGVHELGWPVTASLEALATADVVIDFSLPAATDALLEAVVRYGRPLVLATTGLSDAQWAEVDRAAQRIPLIAAGNYSTGVAVLNHLAAQASRLLPDFDLEVVEMHHRNKIDAPSGTALSLVDAAARGRGVDGRAHANYGRKGVTGVRPKDEIGVVTLRGGDVIGDHTLVLAGGGERLELTHRATNRDLFARGALRAARWLAGKKPGRYGMNDVLGLGV